MEHPVRIKLFYNGLLVLLKNYYKWGTKNEADLDFAQG